MVKAESTKAGRQRSLLHQVRSLCDVSDFALTQALDTMTGQGSLVFHLLGPLAELERSLIRERAQAGPPPGAQVAPEVFRTDDDIDAAKAVLANPDIPDIGVTQIAHRPGVSPATLYRYIPTGRTANLPDV